MIIKTVDFVKSSSKLEQCPAPDKVEYAFVGRSNVGKSSLINYLTDRKKLALTSGNPGKTRLINHFILNDEWYLVDLPGYGYAKVSKKDRAAFDSMIRSYLVNRTNLACLFLLVDIRHAPLQSDLEFLNWIGENGIPFVLVFTKADKLSEQEIETNLENYKTKLLENWEELPRIFITSASKKTGREEILKFITETNAALK